MDEQTIGDGQRPGQAVVTELEREQLTTYLAWAEVEAPWWYWPVYAVAVAIGIGAYAFGPLWGAGGAVLLVVIMGGLVSAVTSRSGVSTPRFRAMPARLRRTFLPIAAVGVLGLAAAVTVFFLTDGRPLLVLGPFVGGALALAGWHNAWWYRRESRRMAAEHGIEV